MFYHDGEVQYSSNTDIVVIMMVMVMLVVQVAQGLEHGLPGASSIVDRTIPTFSRGELPHFAGINTFMKVR